MLIDAETKETPSASLLGVGCDEIVHSLLDIMYANAPYTVIQRAMHIHPTVTGLIATLAGRTGAGRLGRVSVKRVAVGPRDRLTDVRFQAVSGPIRAVLRTAAASHERAFVGFPL